MEALIDVLLATRSANELPGRVLEAIGETYKWDFGAWWSVQESRGILEPAATWLRDSSFAEFEAATLSRTFALGGGLPGRVWLEQRRLSISDVTADDNFPRAIAAARGGVHGALAFPVTVENRVRAVLEFFRTRDVASDADTLNSLDAWGPRIGLALERLASTAELAHSQRVTSLRADIASALASPADLGIVLSDCTSAIVRHLGAAFARVWTVDPGDNALILQASSGMYTHLNGPHSRIPMGSFKIGWIAANRRPHVTNSVGTDPRVTDHEWAEREGMCSFAGHPLVVDNKTVGVVAFFSRAPMRSEVLDEIGPIAATLAQYVERQNKQRELVRSETLKAAMLDMARDAMVAMDSAGLIVEFNAAAEKIFGYERAQVVGRRLAQMIIPSDLREQHRIGMARFLATGEARVVGKTVEVPAMRADGAHMPVELTILLVPNTNPIMFAASIRPVLQHAEPDFAPPLEPPDGPARRETSS